MKHVKPGHTHPIVCLDAGHSGDYNRSPAVPEYYESDMNWTLQVLLKAALERYGIEVITTRNTQDTVLDVYERGAASKGCDLFLSLHSNAVGSGVDETVDYVAIYVPQDGSGNEIGQILADGISLVLGTRQVGRITAREGNNGDYYGVIRGAAAVGTVGMILEHSFHTNTRSTHWLLDAANLARLAEEEAVLIAGYFDVFEDARDVLYRVQTGAFRVKANAEAYLAEVRAAGLDVYITAQTIHKESDEPENYTLKQFVLELQMAVGAAADGIVGPETLRKLPAISRSVNSRHTAVAPVQQRLYALGYPQVGKADGIAGSAFEDAVKAFQSDNNGAADGEITAGGQTWRRLLGLN